VSIVVVPHLPDVELRELPEVPRAENIRTSAIEALRKTLGVSPMAVNPGALPTFEVTVPCLARRNNPVCAGCSEELYEDELCPRRDCEWSFPRLGFSICLDKFDPAFEETDRVRHTFRYKHAEVLGVLKAVIADTDDLSPEIRWDRGFGTFMYNLFFRERGKDA
jgi:hypothetical protein